MRTALTLFVFLCASHAFAANPPGFRFNFALRRAEAGKRVDIQGAPSSESAIQAACGSDGKGCACEFLDANGRVTERAAPARFSYDKWNNYFRCGFTGAEPARVRLTGRGASVTLDVKRALTVAELVGNELDVNRVRYVYRYTCEMNFLEKEGTDEFSFDCSNRATLCDTGNFCLLRTRLPFYLFADTYSTNFSAKPSDKIYNGGGTGRLCGLQIRQYNCADEGGYPVKQFGAYAGQVGIWRMTVLLKASPDRMEDDAGFVAMTGDHGECPPGLVKRIVYAAKVDANDVNPSHNFPRAGIFVKEVADPAAAPAPVSIQRFGQGNCDGTSCSMPESYAGEAKHQAYSTADSSEFCVIPAETLPQRGI